MDERLAEIQKLLTVVEVNSAANPALRTKEDFLKAAELITTCGRILAAEANKDGAGGASLLSRPWKKIIGYLLLALGEYLISD